MFETNCSSIEHQYNTLGDGFNKKMGKNEYTCPIFDDKLLASSKKLKMYPRDSIFPIKQEEICDYNNRCFMYSGFMFDDMIMNLFSDITKKQPIQWRMVYFPKSRMI